MKYKRLKEKLLSKLNNELDNKLEYIFENEDYATKLKYFEFEGSTLELFYNLFFNPFNIDAWLNKSTNILIRRQIKDILAPFDNSEITPIIDINSIGFLRSIRNYVMTKIKKGEIVNIKSSFLNQTYICNISINSFQILNKYHKENCIDSYILPEPINKHILLQFILNPFWNTNGFITQKLDGDNMIINNNWSIIELDFPITIDGRFTDIENQIIENYFNPLLDNQVIYLNQIQQQVHSLIKNSSIDYCIRENIFNVYQLATDKLLNNKELIITNELVDETKRTVIWNCSEPKYNIEKLLEGKRNLFSRSEWEHIYRTDIIDIQPSDLGIILPLLFEGKEELLNIVSYFAQDGPHFLSNTTRKDIIISQSSGLKGTKHLSNYGLEYILKAVSRPINVKMHFIWDKELWKFNHQLMNFSKFDLFHFIDNQTWLNYQQILYLVTLQTSVESKISTLFICRRLQKFYRHLPDFFDTNIHLMLDDTLNLSIQDFEVLKSPIKLSTFSQIIDSSMFYAYYLINSLDFKNSITLKLFNTTGILLLSISEQIVFVTNHIKNIISINEFKLHTEQETVLLEFSCNDKSPWEILLINGKIPLFNDIKIQITLEESCLYFDKKIFWYEQKSEKQLFTVIMKRELYNKFYANLITTKPT